MNNQQNSAPYRYRPVLFFALTYIFTWAFWIPAIFVPGNTGALLMVIGLLAPAVVSTLFVLLSGSKELKQTSFPSQEIFPLQVWASAARWSRSFWLP